MYNDPVEFGKFGEPTYEMAIGNASYTYSQRLVEVVDGLEAGILAFAKNL
jgi:hypothetical protein